MLQQNLFSFDSYFVGNPPHSTQQHNPAVHVDTSRSVSFTPHTVKNAQPSSAQFQIQDQDQFSFCWFFHCRKTHCDWDVSLQVTPKRTNICLHGGDDDIYDDNDDDNDNDNDHLYDDDDDIYDDGDDDNMIIWGTHTLTIPKI